MKDFFALKTRGQFGSAQGGQLQSAQGGQYRRFFQVVEVNLFPQHMSVQLIL